MNAAFEARPAWRRQAAQTLSTTEIIAVEVPVSLVYNGIAHAVMLATPTDLESLALGFSLTENILQKPSELYSCELVQNAEGYEVQMQIANERFEALKGHRRNLMGRSGCGLCGSESLALFAAETAAIASTVTIAVTALHRALDRLSALQPVRAATGATHAAGWCTVAGDVLAVMEDVGRHNALDKLIGAMHRRAVDLTAGFVVVSSRASYEMVQKSVRVGIPLLAAISAPTQLAVDLARRSGMTLIAFARSGSHTVYSHPQRMIEP